MYLTIKINYNIKYLDFYGFYYKFSNSVNDKLRKY